MDERGSSTGSSKAHAQSAGDAAELLAGGPETVISPLPPNLPSHPLEVAKSLCGEELDHFVLEDYVGIGGMGTVFRAHDTLLSRTVAVKVLSPEQAEDPDTVRRFRQEAQSAARLDNENIARVFYIGQCHEYHYIVFEYIDGLNGRDLVDRAGQVPLADAINYTLQISALSHASSRGVVHRDIKPSNILVTREGRAKLVDMGLARLSEIEHSGGDLTASNVTLGTFDYISPEQARDPRSVDVRSDIYSLGCTLYYMLTGRPPYPEGTVLQKLLQHQGESPPDPREFNAKIPEEVVTILAKMMAKDRTLRYQTPEALVRDLLLTAGNLGLQAAGPAGMVWVAAGSVRVPFWERHLPWFAPIAALVLVAAVLEIFSPQSFFGRGETEPQEVAFVPLESTSGTPGIGSPTGAPPRAGTGDGGKTANPGSTAQTDPPLSGNPTGNSGTPGSGTENPSTVPPIIQPASTNNTGGTDTGSPGTGTEPAPRETTSPEISADRVFVIKREDRERAFASLDAACAAAEDGDVIDVHLNGMRIEKPVTLRKKFLTIRAAEGCQPRLVFRHAQAEGSEPQTHMLKVIGGRLELVNLHLEMEVEDVNAKSWALLQTQGCEEVRLSQCSLRIRDNSAHLGVAFFEIEPVAGSDAEMMNEGVPVRSVVIQLTDCIATGEGVLLRSDRLQSVDFTWQNGFLALSRHHQLLHVSGSQMPYPDSRQISFTLEQLTAYLPGGLSRMAYAEQPHPTTRIDCKNSILVGDDESTLLEHVNVSQFAEIRPQDRVTWKGDHNFYEGYRSFWTVNLMEADPLRFDFDGWRDLWGQRELSPKYQKVVWKSPLEPDPAKPFSPERFRLANVSENPAIGGSTQGSDAGCDFSRLPLHLLARPGANPLEPEPLNAVIP